MVRLHTRNKTTKNSIVKVQQKPDDMPIQLESTTFWDGEFINHKTNPITEKKLRELIKEKRKVLETSN